MLTDLLELLEIESVGGTDAEAHAQSWVADKLRAWGWDVELHEDDPAAFADHPERRRCVRAARSSAGHLGGSP